MAVRVRSDARVLCAAMHPALPGDIYIDDTLHYNLCEIGALVTEPWDAPDGRGGHAKHGEWWWHGQVPTDVVIEERPR